MATRAAAKQRLPLILPTDPSPPPGELAELELTVRPIGDESKEERWRVPLLPGERTDDAMARVKLDPSMNAALTVRQWRGNIEGDSVRAITHEIQRLSEEVRQGDLSRAEEMLTAQAHSLDAVFGNLSRLAGNQLGSDLAAADTLMRLALKAQAQCRASIEALALLKNPPSTTFVRQANIANQQQVNNGAQAVAPPPKELAPPKTVPHLVRSGKNESRRTKLLEVRDGQRLDA